ncbi:MAG: penicillin-binding transpeptidase domain-containing protein [Cyclobacteriaceae bacterium]|nr:penicillin-binding transpeptidase domain-containing protein [Cyclobacteriaceae bacterium]
MEGEATPRIKHPSDKSWSGITLPWMSIGYEIELTPLQILAFYNGIANDGQVIRPIIVKSINRADKEIEEFKTEVLVRKICSGSTLKKIKKLLEGVVENGTAVNIRDSHYKIAGKTGTAQKIVDGRYTRQQYQLCGLFSSRCAKIQLHCSDQFTTRLPSVRLQCHCPGF